MTIRELLTKWGFKADLEGPKKFGAALNAAKNVAATATKVIIGIGAAGASAAVGIFKLTERIAEHADEIGKASARTGVGIDQLQKLKFAANKTEVSFHGATRGFRQLSLVASQAAKGNKGAKAAFDELGISIKGASGKLKSADEIAMESIIAISAMKDENQRLTVSQRLLGRAGMELAPMFAEGTEALLDFYIAAKDTGQVLDKDAIEAGDRFDKSLRSLKGTLGSITSQLGGALMPVVEEYVKVVADWVKQNRAVIGAEIPKVVKSIAEALKSLVTVENVKSFFSILTGGVKLFVKLVQWILDHKTAIKYVVGSLLALTALSKLAPIVMLLGKLGPLLSLAGAAATGLSAAATGLLSALGPLGALLAPIVASMAAFAVGWKIGKWLDEWLGLSDKLGQKLWNIHKAIVGIDEKGRRKGVAASNLREGTYASIIEQAGKLREMSARGVKTFEVAPGKRVELTQANAMAVLMRRIAQSGLSEEGKAGLMPALQSITGKIGAPVEGARAPVNQTITTNVNVPPGLPQGIPAKTAEAVNRVLRREKRQTAADVR